MIKNKLINLKYFIIFLSLTVLVSCQTIKLVNNNSPHVMKSMNVTPSNNWNMLSKELWSIDGILLNRVIFVEAKEGDYVLPLKNQWGLAKEGSPKYKEGTQILEVPDLIKYTFEVNGWENVKLLETQPFNFLNNNGFRLNFSLSNEGLKNKALAYGSIINKKLYLMIYIAPLVEFYDRYEDDFISMAENATL